MLSLGKRLLGLGGTAAAGDACAACAPESLGCRPAQPGSVTPHDAHILLKLAAPPGADPAATDEAWWQDKVDGAPAPAAVSEALEQHREALGGIKVKVTAFDYLTPHPLAAGAGTTDMLVFPGGRLYRGLPLEQAGAAALAALAAAGAAAAAAAPAAAPAAEALPLPAPEPLGGLTLLVCVHVRRDARCATLGPPLAARLAALAAQRGLGEDRFRVFRSSHVGGHVHAGNVIVYGGGTAAASSAAAAPAGEGGAATATGGAARGGTLDGDWFGGLHAGNAEEFLDALLASKAEAGGAGDAALRRWWRGRIGMSKDQQVAFFEAAVSDIEDLGLRG
eukprot:scaffold4.g4917.t1